MPSLPINQAITASQQGVNPLLGWQFENVPWSYRKGAYVRIYARSTTANLRMTVFSGSTTIQQRSPVQSGGTAGQTPTPFTTTAIDFVAAPGDRLIMLIDEVGGAAANFDAIITIDPVR